MRVMLVCVAIILSGPAAAQSADPASFSYHDVETLDDMQVLVRRSLPVGTSRGLVRSMLVEQGRGTPVRHPSQARVEKYIYDIDLCGYYVWRWNISADYDAANRVRQLYVNGEPALADGAPVRRFDQVKKRQGTESISRMSRSRPEAVKGERSLAYLLYDLDGDHRTIDDQQLIGGGPTRADPVQMGKLHAYKVEPWRSIFDQDPTSQIAPFKGDCARVDAEMQGRVRARDSSPVQ